MSLYSVVESLERLMKNKENQSSSLLLVGVGTMLTSMIVSGFLLGYGVDYWLETTPLFMLLFGALGFIGGGLKVYRILSRL